MSKMSSSDVVVTLCDWRGYCIWLSVAAPRLKIGDFMWEHLDAKSQVNAKAVFSRVAALRESQQVEVENKDGERFRVWLWPLDSPDSAVCMLGMRVPIELALLTARERACLELLSQGTETKSIAEQLDISLSTVHTHLKRAREKLQLPNAETLISFAARYCYPTTKPLSGALGQGSDKRAHSGP